MTWLSTATYTVNNLLSPFKNTQVGYHTRGKRDMKAQVYGLLDDALKRRTVWRLRKSGCFGALH